MESLAYKLHKQQKRIKYTTLKTRPTLLLSKSEINQIVKHFPKELSTLTSLIGAEKATVYGNDVLKVICAHPRDQEAFLDCVLEMDAFVRGGDPGIYTLGLVYRQIMGHFKVFAEINEIFDILDLSTHQLSGKLQRKYHRVSDEDTEATFQWASSKRS
jgi:hypothetical protein